jgi:hypothetical protein
VEKQGGCASSSPERRGHSTLIYARFQTDWLQLREADQDAHVRWPIRGRYAGLPFTKPGTTGSNSGLLCYRGTVPGPGGSQVKRVTRDVELSALRDLLDRPPRATVAFVDGGGVSLLPARARCSVTQHLFGVSLSAVPDLTGREVVLVIDDGPYWFELRGVSVRGIAAGVALPSGGGDLAWYAIEPRRVLAWDYGTIREE